MTKLGSIAISIMFGAVLAAPSVEQTSQGELPAAKLVTSFDGLGLGFEGPQGSATFRNPSDNSLAVGPNHVIQIVNSRVAIYTKDGKPLYGPVLTNTVFKDFGGACEANNNGDAVVRYDQLADRWLIVMPVFRRAAVRPDQPQAGKSGEPAESAGMSFASTTSRETFRCTSREPMRRIIFFGGWPALPSTNLAISVSGTRSAALRILPDNDSRAGWRMIRRVI